jgi:NodT family efflux transporter outer membrane factor (OMF) lipoprotein
MIPPHTPPAAVTPAVIARILRVALAYATAICASACAVGPDYHPPDMDAPQAFSQVPAASATSPRPEPGTPAASAPVDTADWWHSLHDQELDSLIERAIMANPDIGIALTRLQEARTRQVVFAANALPTASADAAGAHGTGSDLTRGGALPALRGGDNKGALPIQQIAGFAASWELDLFGGIRREIEAGHYDVQAATAARNAVMITVIADVARDYVQLRGLQMRLAILHANLDSTAQSQEFEQARFDRGISNELDLQLAIREYSTQQAELPSLQSSIASVESSIATLLNEYPEAMRQELSEPGVIPDLPSGIATGMPVDVLERRPDVRESERALAAATARIGVATSNLFPRVGLVGGIGVQATSIGLQHGTHIWDFGPSVYWPILDFGALDAMVGIADLQTHERLLDYRKTIIHAVQDADDAITDFSAQQQRLQDLSNAVAASQRAVELAQQRYDRGLTDYLNVVDAQRQAYSLEDHYVSAQQSAAEAFVYLYRALGGGWEHYQSLPPVHHPEPAVVAAFHHLLVHDHVQ